MGTIKTTKALVTEQHDSFSALGQEHFSEEEILSSRCPKPKIV